MLFWTALISSWLTFVLFFAAPFGVIYWGIVLIILFIRKSKMKWYLLAFSAWTFIPTFNFLNGTKDYFTGQATMKHVGLPTREFYNLGKDYRTWNSTSGCIVMGSEPLTQGSNNLAVKFWTNLLGYQRGVYRGRYPGKADALKMIEEHGEEVEIAKSEGQIKFTINSKIVEVNGVRNWDTKELDSCKRAKVAIVDNELILIRPLLHGQVVYLADNNTGRIFAGYEF